MRDKFILAITFLYWGVLAFLSVWTFEEVVFHWFGYCPDWVFFAKWILLWLFPVYYLVKLLIKHVGKKESLTAAKN